MFSAGFRKPVYLAVYTLFFGVMGPFTVFAEEGAAPVQLEENCCNTRSFYDLRWRVGENLPI